MNAASFGLGAFILSQLIIMALAAIPKERWRSAPNLIRRGPESS